MHSLEERIKAAFADNRYPGDDHLTVYDPAGRKFDETFQLLRGKTWQEMPVAEFMSGDTPVPDLAPEAFHYYMPALLMGALEDEDYLAVCLVHSFTRSAHEELSRLYPVAGGDYVADFEKRLVLFTPEQRAVIADVLREFVPQGWEDEADIREAVDFLAGPSVESE